jgi:Spy/CpxP family protein refolding chaperone
MVSFPGARQNRPPVLRALAFLTVWLYAISVQAQSTPYRWWLAHDIQTQLHLTPEQTKKINDVFESTLATRRAQRQELDGLDRQLDTLLDSATADDQEAAALIRRVEAARARRNVARMVMLYRMRQILTPEQRRWFDARAQRSYRQ